jgi:hypothetical protein
MKPDYATIGIVLASIFFLLQVASIIITIWRGLRRTPPIDQTLKDYTLKADFDRHCENQDKVMTQLFDLQRKTTEDVGNQVKDLNTNLSVWQNGVSHQIGKLEGRLTSREEK